jgi:acetyl-CoA carboxylase biotin carboxyl carrier protein
MSTARFDALELLVERGPGAVKLLSPDVGYYTGAVDAGRLLAPGDSAGWLLQLGRARALIVPDGVTGRVSSRRPERVHHPVGYGDLLVELAPLAAADAAEGHAQASEPEASGALVFASPTAGRFWHRSAPGEPPLVAPGTVLEEGTAIGLVEVMKTFAQVPYRPGPGLPRRARVLRVRVADGAEVEQGQALIELEPLERTP